MSEERVTPIKQQSPEPAPALLDGIKTQYAEYFARRELNPFISPVLRLSLYLNDQLRSGQLSTDDLQRITEELAQDGLIKRGEKLARYLGDTDARKNTGALSDIIENLAFDDGAKRDFETFQSALSQVFYGFVFTAHPTFGMTRELNRALAHYAAAPGNEKDEAASNLIKSAAINFEPPTLRDEEEFSHEAIGNLHDSVETLYRTAFIVAQELYPDRWTEIRPKLCTIATWVGFDLDGRNDINWTATFAAKLDLQIQQTEYYRNKLALLCAKSETLDSALAPALNLLDNSLRPLREHHKFFSAYDGEREPGHPKLQRASRELMASRDARMLGPGPLINVIEKAVKKTKNEEDKTELLVLLSQLENFGLSRAHVHFRINAAQVHNAIRKYVELTTHPADPRFRQTYMDKLLSKFRQAGPCNIHFGNILEEEASAIRLFMLMQQIIQHVDNHTPVRFLIAETESSFTVMSALYYARRFGIENHVDICPLFETERALKRASRIVDHLLEVPEFRSYARARGRLCLQTGYSDAGRYIGQTPASGSIERLKERIARLMVKYELDDTAMLCFDTHGESSGRGGHPESMRARMEYLTPPHFLAELKESNMPYIQESSFQGGDGYLYFMSKETSLAALTRILGYWTEETQEKPGDPYYEDRAGITEFLTIIKEFQDELMQSPQYGSLLSAFGMNLMRGTGSRAAKRQYDYSKTENKAPMAREYRAIPHNAVLAQMGVLVNTFSGLGSAVRTDPAFYSFMKENSPRFRSLMRLALFGACKSQADVMKAYIDTLDPMFWLIRESHAGDPVNARRCGSVAKILEHISPSVDIQHVFRKIYADMSILKRFESDAGVCNEEEHTALACLHAVRLCLIQEIYLLATEIPYYSPQHDVSRNQLLKQVYKLNIPAADILLREIFPVHPDESASADYGEASDYSAEEKEIYAEEQTRIFDPLVKMHRMIQDVSSAITHHVGFTG